MRLGCLSATEAGIFPCGAVQILATRSISRTNPAQDSRLPRISRPHKSLCLQLELFFVGFVFFLLFPFFLTLPFCVLFFLALYAFCCAWPGAFCFMLDSMDFYVTAFWFRLRLSHRLVSRDGSTSLFPADFMVHHSFSSGKDHTEKMVEIDFENNDIGLNFITVNLVYQHEIWYIYCFLNLHIL